MYEFHVDDVNLIDIDWKSPLQLKINDVCEEAGRAAAKAFDDMVFGAVAEVGIEVDRDELIRVLAYDRGQYEKGFVDGYRAAKNEIVRCEECKNYNQNPYSEEDEKWCMCWSDWIPTEPDDFCSSGERKDDAENH